jgi:HlyD family secretion protein
MRVTIEEEGKTRVRDRYVVSAPVPGYMERITLEVGDVVARGQIIVMLSPTPSPVLDPRTRAETEARVQAARARVAAAESSVESADARRRAAAADAGYWEGQLKRIEKLVASGDMAREEADRTRNEQERAAATLKAAEHAIETARAEMRNASASLEAEQASLRVSAANPGARSSERVPVPSPVGGRVLKVVRKSEGPVTAGEPLIEVANANALEVEVELLSPDAVRIGPGTRVLFERWGGPKPLEGRVRHVEPVAFTKISALGVEEQRVLVIIDFTSPQDQWERLGDRYRVEASFVTWESDSVLQVPASALFRDAQGWAVFLIEEGKARKRPVQVDHRTGLTAEVTTGLKEGEVVIAHPDDTINEDSLVAPRG